MQNDTHHIAYILYAAHNIDIAILLITPAQVSPGGEEVSLCWMILDSIGAHVAVAGHCVSRGGGEEWRELRSRNRWSNH